MYLVFDPNDPNKAMKADPKLWAMLFEDTDPIYPELIKNFGLEEIKQDKIKMFHLVYDTVYTRNNHDQFAMVSLTISENDESVDLISKNPLFIDKWYDPEPINLYSFWLKLPEKYQDRNYAVNRNTELENKYD